MMIRCYYAVYAMLHCCRAAISPMPCHATPYADDFDAALRRALIIDGALAALMLVQTRRRYTPPAAAAERY